MTRSPRGFLLLFAFGAGAWACADGDDGAAHTPVAVAPAGGPAPAIDGSVAPDGGGQEDAGSGTDADAAEPIVPDPGAISPLSEEPGRLFYQVHVRAFWDSAADGTGDLLGLAQKLDYLVDLGVDTLLLMPVFKSTGDMGYIPLDFFAIEAAYGSRADLRTLVREAHRRGMRVVLDAPVNHIGDQSDWFKRARQRDCAGGSTVAPECRYFHFAADPANTAPWKNWRKPWDWGRTTWAKVWQKPAPFDAARDRDEYYYATFFGVMPDLAYWDFERDAWNAPVVETMTRFFREWSELGVDGFRIDAARHLVEGRASNEPGEPRNLELLRHFLKETRSTREGASFVAEAWTDAAEIETYLPDATDMVLDFPFMQALRDGLGYDEDNAEPLKGVLARYQGVQARYPAGHRIVFAGNHDVPRLATRFPGSDAKIRMAHFLALQAPQVPLLFYGEELGLEGKVKRPGPEPADPGSETAAQREERLKEYVWTSRAFPWDGDSPSAGFPGNVAPTVGLPDNYRDANLKKLRADPASLWSYVRALIAVRKTFPLTRATTVQVIPEIYGAMLGYTMITPAVGADGGAGGGARCRTVVVNMGRGGPYTIAIKHQHPGGACAAAPLNERLAEKARREIGAAGQVRYAIEPYGKVVLDGF